MPSNIARKKGRKNRKHGRGVSKAEHSRFGSYAGIFAHSQKMKENRALARERRFARRKEKRAAKNGPAFPKISLVVVLACCYYVSCSENLDSGDQNASESEVARVACSRKEHGKPVCEDS